VRILRGHVVAVAALIALSAVPLHAQEPRPSQHGAVAQTVNQTTITLEYDRPVARGRELFGGIVVWERTWTPGANRTTWIDFTGPVRVEGHEFQAGRYGIWAVPHDGRPWEVILVEEWDTFHTMFPAGSPAVRFEVTPEAGEHMETLAWYFPVVGPYEATLRMHWGTTVLPFRIEVGR